MHGFSWSSASVISDRTSLAATRSSAEPAATPARPSPDFSSLALAMTSRTSLKENVLPRTVAWSLMADADYTKIACVKMAASPGERARPRQVEGAPRRGPHDAPRRPEDAAPGRRRHRGGGGGGSRGRGGEPLPR